MASSGAASSSQAAKGKVLIVDDEEGMRDLLKTILESDYHISEADCGAALLRALDLDQPDVVLLDMKLPDANGLGLLPAIKQRWPATEVIVLTGQPNDSGTAGWANEAVNRGAFGLMSKSAGFDFRKLLDGIGLAVARRQQAREASELSVGD
ncbi:MAG TPA: response regulator [Candidatus Paceibacterota bacterium]|nr:response regulator [Verrucomicrobiota bacterium]HSA11492.1 response regulator [Candidatus Paceibacterota bacterium]